MGRLILFVAEKKMAEWEVHIPAFNGMNNKGRVTSKEKFLTAKVIEFKMEFISLWINNYFEIFYYEEMQFTDK